MAGTDEASARRDAAARLRAKAIKMRREGASLDSIGSRLGVTRSTARRLVARELSSLSSESGIDEMRLLHADVLMELWRALYPAAVSGDPAAVDRFLRVEERISRLLGLDAQPEGNGDGRAPAEARREQPALVDD
jgi:Homeodomain-like domain